MNNRDIEQVAKTDITNGALIVFEGLDGCGKTTQLELARRWLKDRGYKVFHTEWHASVEVKKALTKGGARRRMLSPITANLVHAMDFADRYTWQILPRLRQGYVVLADRYVYTAFARGVVRGCKQSWLQAVYEFACAPLITFYFRVTPEVALDRILRDRVSMKYFEAGMDLNYSSDVEESFLRFQGDVMAQYDSLAGSYGFITIDGAAEQKQISESVKYALRDLATVGKLPISPKQKKKAKT